MQNIGASDSEKYPVIVLISGERLLMRAVLLYEAKKVAEIAAGGSHQDGVTPNPPRAKYSVMPVQRKCRLMAPRDVSLRRTDVVAIGRIADMARVSPACLFDLNDPEPT